MNRREEIKINNKKIVAAKLIKNLENINLEISNLYNKKDELVEAFYESFPVADFISSIPVVDYHGEEYVVTDMNFGDLTVFLETEPYSGNNQVATVPFKLFVELYETYREYKIKR